MATPVSDRNPNALASEKSPYLRQHATNPVDWLAWNPESLARAAAVDKPIFLSVGYAACHWCHVMERESFENEAIADVLNQHFVSIKVDREERPDIDEIYMTAVQRMTGHGGWPMSVFLTPDGRPFYGGTYFPPTRRHGRIGFLELIGQLAEAWNERRDEVESVADTLAADLQESTRQRPIAGPAGTPDPQQLMHDAVTELEERFDVEYGGFGGAPKFPPHHALRLLCRAVADGDSRAVALLTITLDRMAQGGLYDHVGGGFHRYCTDRIWLLPHFEKMLYDNAMLARVYAEAGALLDNPAWRRVARETCDWVLGAMREPEGGFVSAFDADSEGEEGRYYVWNRDEAEAIAGTAWCERYGIVPGGNFHDEATGRRTGACIPHLGTGPEAQPLPSELTPAEAAAREALRDARQRRVPPLRDHKVLTNWNGLMIGALARCGQVLGEPRYIDAATAAARFCLGPLSPGNALMHRWADGEAAIPAFLDDTAYLADGLLDLANATGDPSWNDQARRLMQVLLDDFVDDEDGGFFFASERRHERLVARSKDIFDGALPSANGVAVRALARIGGPLADEARAIASAYHGVVSRAPHGTATWIDAMTVAFPRHGQTLANPATGGQPVALLHEPDIVPLQPGATIRTDLVCTFAPGIHAAAMETEGVGVFPTRIVADQLPDGVRLVGVRWPLPSPVAVFGGTVDGWSGNCAVVLEWACDAGVAPFEGEARLVLHCQPCTDNHCLAPSTWELPVRWRIAG